jgi:hypothetical protein
MKMQIKQVRPMKVHINVRKLDKLQTTGKTWS